MAITHTLTFGWNGTNGGNLSSSVAISGSQEINESLAITASTTDQAVPFVMLNTACLEMYLVSDQDIQWNVNANHLGSPILTVNLKAGKPWEWYAASGQPNPFSAPITAFYFTNAGGVDANLNIRSLRS